MIAAGAPLGEAKAAVLLLHGRGATARSILELASALDVPGIAYVAPEAPERTWYPHSFLVPLDRNEPKLSQALGLVGDTIGSLGLPAEKIAIAGFSQGGCLALEYAARNAQRYGGIAGLSAGLIGPEGTPRDYAGSLAGTPVFLGCSDIDDHIPLARVQESAGVLSALGADVTTRIYPGFGHAINDDEIEHLRGIVMRLVVSP